MILLVRNSKFRLLWVAGLFSDVAITLYILAHGWLALLVTDSAFWVGATAGMAGLGMMLCAGFAGVMADRLDRRALFIVAQTVQAAMFAVVALLVFTDRIELWHILATALADGVLMAVKLPARMTLVLDVAGRENLLKANAANFVAMTTAGITVPLVAGPVVDTFGIGWVYAVMVVSLAVSGVFMVFLRGFGTTDRKRDTSPLADLKEGIRFTLGTPQIRVLVLMMLSSEVFGWSHETMMPVMAGKVLDVGPTGLGYMFSAGSAGALISSLTLSALGEGRSAGRLLVFGYMGFGACLVLFAASPWLPLSLLLLLAAYGSGVLYEATLITVLQRAVPHDMRGRVLSIQSFTWGMTGFSGFYTGSIAALLSAPVAIAIGGSVLALNGLRVSRRVIRQYNRASEQPEPAAADVPDVPSPLTGEG